MKKRKKKRLELFCPVCSHYPLIIDGERTLAGWKKIKATCPTCLYEYKVDK